MNRAGPSRQDSSWTAYLGGPRHDASAGEQLNAEPQPLWSTQVGRAVRGSPALGESVIVVGVAERQVVLLDRTSGQPFWRQTVDGTVLSGPLLDGDRLYVATEETPDGTVRALRLRDGDRLWKRRTGSVAAPLALLGPALYAGTETGIVYRLGLEHGEVTWRRQLPGAVRAGPVPNAAGVAVATTADTIFLLDAVSGDVLARQATAGTVLGTPVLDGQRLYAGTTAGELLEIALPALEIVWRQPVGSPVLGALALVGETLYAVTRDGALWVVPLAERDSARTHLLDVAALAGPTPTAAGVLVASVSGEVLLVDAASGSIQWRTTVEGPVEHPPLVLDRQLIVVGGRGTIHTYR